MNTLSENVFLEGNLKGHLGSAFTGDMECVKGTV